jgi:hypothetical protein
VAFLKGNILVKDSHNGTEIISVKDSHTHNRYCTPERALFAVTYKRYKFVIVTVSVIRVPSPGSRSGKK